MPGTYEWWGRLVGPWNGDAATNGTIGGTAAVVAASGRMTMGHHHVPLRPWVLARVGSGQQKDFGAIAFRVESDRAVDYVVRLHRHRTGAVAQTACDLRPAISPPVFAYILLSREGFVLGRGEMTRDDFLGVPDLATACDTLRSNSQQTARQTLSFVKHVGNAGKVEPDERWEDDVVFGSVYLDWVFGMTTDEMKRLAEDEMRRMGVIDGTNGVSEPLRRGRLERDHE
jgi:hypothetical protein